MHFWNKVGITRILSDRQRWPPSWVHCCILHPSCLLATFYALHCWCPGGGSTGSGHRHLTPGRRKHMQVLDGQTANSIRSTFNPLKNICTHLDKYCTFCTERECLLIWPLLSPGVHTGLKRTRAWQQRVHSLIWTVKKFRKWMFWPANKI